MYVDPRRRAAPAALRNPRARGPSVLSGPNTEVRWRIPPRLGASVPCLQVRSCTERPPSCGRPRRHPDRCGGVLRPTGTRLPVRAGRRQREDDGAPAPWRPGREAGAAAGRRESLRSSATNGRGAPSGPRRADRAHRPAGAGPAHLRPAEAPPRPPQTPSAGVSEGSPPTGRPGPQTVREDWNTEPFECRVRAALDRSAARPLRAAAGDGPAGRRHRRTPSWRTGAGARRADRPPRDPQWFHHYRCASVGSRRPCGRPRTTSEYLGDHLGRIEVITPPRRSLDREGAENTGRNGHGRPARVTTSQDARPSTPERTARASGRRGTPVPLPRRRRDAARPPDRRAGGSGGTSGRDHRNGRLGAPLVILFSRRCRARCGRWRRPARAVPRRSGTSRPPWSRPTPPGSRRPSPRPRPPRSGRRRPRLR